MLKEGTEEQTWTTKSYRENAIAGVKGSHSQLLRPVMANFQQRRKFLGPKLGAVYRDGEIGGRVSVKEILRDPRLSSLGFDVLDQLKEQFSENRADVSPNDTNGADTDGLVSDSEIVAYRQKLQFWAQMFETLLEESLEELERLDG